MFFSHPLRRFLFWLSLPILVGVAVLTTAIKGDLSTFIVAGDNAEEMLLAGEMQSGVLSRRYILSLVEESGHAITDQGQIDALLNQWRAIQGVTDVWRVEQSPATFQVIGTVYAPRAAQLFSWKPDADLMAWLTPDALKLRANGLKNALLSSQASRIKSLALQDPLLLSLNGFKKFAEQWQHSQQAKPRVFQNLLLETGASGLDIDAQRNMQLQIIAAFDTWKTSQPQSFRLEMTGVPVFALATQSMIENDIAKLGALSSIVLIILFLWLFRSIHALVIVSSMLIATTAVAVLVTQAIFGYVHGMTLAIGSTLSGVCIDYAIHGLIHGQSVVREKREAAIARIWPSMAMGAITTSVGYGVLGFSGYPGFKQIAVYAAAALLSALLLTRYVLPSLVLNLPKVSESSYKGVLAYWLQFCQRYRSRIVIVVVCGVIGAASQLSGLRWIQDLQELTPEMNSLKAADKAIRERMISIEPGRFVLISAQDTETALQRAERLYPVLERLKAEQKLQDYFGLYPWLLSAQQQRHNAAVLHERLDSSVVRNWQQALAEQGLSVAKLGNLDYPDILPLTAEQLLASPLKQFVNNQLLIQPQQVLIMIWLAEHDPQALQIAISGMENVHYFSQRDLLNHLVVQYTERALMLAAWGMLLIFTLLWLGYRRSWPALQTLLPSLCAVILIAGIWSLTGQPLSFLHLIGFLLAISICDDFGIFFQENRGGEINLTYRAMAASMLTSAAAFGCLAIAETSVLRTLACVVGSCVVLGFLMCPVLIAPKSNAA